MSLIAQLYYSYAVFFVLLRLYDAYRALSMTAAQEKAEIETEQWFIKAGDNVSDPADAVALMGQIWSKIRVRDIVDGVWLLAGVITQYRLIFILNFVVTYGIGQYQPKVPLRLRRPFLFFTNLLEGALICLVLYLVLNPA